MNNWETEISRERFKEGCFHADAMMFSLNTLFPCAPQMDVKCFSNLHPQGDFTILFLSNNNNDNNNTHNNNSLSDLAH